MYRALWTKYGLFKQRLKIDPETGSLDEISASRVLDAEARAEVKIRTASKALKEDSLKFFEDNPHYKLGIDNLENFVEESATPIQKAIQKSTEQLYKGFSKIGLSPTFDRGIRSGNSVLQMLTVQLLNSPVRQIINHNSADAWATQLQETFAGKYSPKYTRLLSQYVQENNLGPSKVFGTEALADGRNLFDNKARASFSADVQKYMAYRREGKLELAEQMSESVKEMANNLNLTYKKILQEHHKAGTDDFADVMQTDWHFPHSWDGGRIAALENKIGTKRLIDDLSRSIASKATDPENKALHKVFAVAIVEAAKDNNISGMLNSFGQVTSGGKDYLVRAIEMSGIDKELRLSSEELAERILYQGSDRGKIKSARARIDLDVTAPVGDSGMTILDLLDNDVLSQTDRAVRGQAAEIARIRATNGALQRRNIDMYRRAVADEAQRMGVNPKEHVELFDFIMSQFTEGAYGKGISRNVGRLNKLTPLSFLAQGGFPAVAELGLAMGMSGLKGFEKYVGRSLTTTLKDTWADPKHKDLINSLSHAGEYYAPQELYIGSADLDSVSTLAADRVGRTIDTYLDSGLRVMGYTSGMHHVHKVSQMVVLETQNNMMIKAALNPEQYTPRQLEALGVDADVIRIVNENKDYISFSEDGGVTGNGFNRWASQDDVDLYRRALNGQMDWLVQTKRRGEDHAWAYTDIGSIFTSLRNFPLNALHTKTIRAGRQADKMVASMFVTQAVLASLAYGAKQLVNGKEVTTEDLAKGALGWSAQLSPLMTFIDPALYYSGLDQVGIQGMYTESISRRDFGAFPMPAGFSAIEQIAGSLRAPLDLIEDGKLDWKTANAMQSLPIIGRMYGTKLILDELRE
jgi:hypothetical protein